MDITVTADEIIAAIEAMDLAVLGGVFLAVIAIIAAPVIFGAIRYLLKSIGYSKMYRKAGEDPWKAFIPVYNTYTNYKISWNSKFFFLFAALYALFSVMTGTTLTLQLVSLIAGIALIVVDAKQNIKMAKLFGKGTGTGIALMFFPGITSLVLGLGKAEFQAAVIEND